MTIENIRQTLNDAKSAGIQNVMALRGDLPNGEKDFQEKSAFSHAVDLVKFIRQEYGDTFGIAVGGYPDGHIECTSYEDDIKHLKEKVDAGADFIVTQLFYDYNQFKKFENDCRKIGIKCPILPAFMTLQSYNTFTKMISFCKIHVPNEERQTIEKYKSNESELKEYGIIIMENLIKQCLNNGSPGIHFYTLNLEKSVRRIILDLDLLNNSRRLLPWRSSPLLIREGEEVRPIFWANRPQSYINRTTTQLINNNNINEKLEVSHATALATFELQHSNDNYKPWVVDIQTIEYVNNIFISFIDGKLSCLPWCENIDIETDIIVDKLRQINSLGFLTINSQPQINGVESSDKKFGWGGSGGLIYQKAYLEFFCSAEKLSILLKNIENYPSIIYSAVDMNNNFYTNLKDTTKPLTVTWGVFPDRPIIQPTIVDCNSFLIWKDEAFGLWQSQWKNCYPTDSKSAEIIDFIIKNYYLVFIVENDYIYGDLYHIFQ